MDLLHLIGKVLTCGGAPGKAGTNGQGGKGGPGGDGGSSYSWTEYSTEYYTDSDGNSQSRSVSTSNYNFGGSTGPQGKNGV